MTDPIVDWKRFWTPRTAAISFHDGGYLIDPETEAGRAFNRDVVPFSTIANQQCLVLLGEPGIGKTTAMASLRSEIDGLIAQRGERSIWVNLNECGQESTLYRELFDSPRYKEWLPGSFTLHLFVDSLDECLLRIDTVANVLLKRLKGCASGEQLEVAIADFWCAMIADDLRSLRTWDMGRGGTLGQWLMVLAAYACKAKLRQTKAAA